MDVKLFMIARMYIILMCVSGRIIKKCATNLPVTLKKIVFLCAENNDLIKMFPKIPYGCEIIYDCTYVHYLIVRK